MSDSAIQSNDVPPETAEDIFKTRMSRTGSVDWRVLPQDQQALVRCTFDGHLYLAVEPSICDACKYCRDICDIEDCANCIEKVKQIGPSDPGKRYTLCQVRRCRNLRKCWVVAGSTVYDATSVLIRHPGGLAAVMRYSGGPDCTEHFNFHSSRAKNKWKSLRIGEICYCEGSKDDPYSPPEHADGLCIEYALADNQTRVQRAASNAANELARGWGNSLGNDDDLVVDGFSLL